MIEKIVTIPESILQAHNMKYDNTNSGLTATDVQAAIDEIKENSETNVQPDWEEADQESDAFIQNKPTFEVLTVEDVERMTGLTAEELEGLASVIADTEVRIDKTYSSSKIYTELQRVLDDSKSYTLAEIARTSGASYKIAASTDDMVSTKFIYLLANADTYDMYICETEDSEPVKIGSTSVNLTDYYTKNECDDRYVLATAFALVNSSIGDVNNLQTEAKVLVDAINEVLSTTNQNVSDINTSISELSAVVDQNAIDTAASIDEVKETVGDISALSTTDKTSLVNAVNEVKRSIGDISALSTTDKTSLVNAVNEVKRSIDEIEVYTEVTQAEIAEVESKVDGLISDTSSSTTSTYSSAKIDEKYGAYTFGTADATQWLKLTLGNSSKFQPITITDQYGGKVEITGMADDGTYKSVKLVRYSYGDWTTYSATDYTTTDQGDANYKIRRLYYYPTNGCYYLEIRQWCTIKVSGATTKPEMVTSLPAETSKTTSIPESQFASKSDLATQTANRQVKTFNNGGSTAKYYKICSAITAGYPYNIKATTGRIDSTVSVEYFSAIFRDSRYNYTSQVVLDGRFAYNQSVSTYKEYCPYFIVDANQDLYLYVPSYAKTTIEIDTRAITIDGTEGTPVEDYVYNSFDHRFDERINDSATNTVSTWSSSKIASEIGAKVTKTQYRGSRSIDISTGGKLTLIVSSEYASQAGCYMLLSNFNTEPLLIELGRNNIGQFSVTATHKSQNVDTITVTAAGDDYSWFVLQF